MPSTDTAQLELATDDEDDFQPTGLERLIGPVAPHAWDVDEPGESLPCDIEWMRRKDWAEAALWQTQQDRLAEEKAAKRMADKAILQHAKAGDFATVAKLTGKSNWFPPAASNDNRKGGSVYPGIVSSADFVSGFVPPDYHLDGVAQAGFIYSLTAGTGTGKTAVMLALTASTALGTTLCGREVRKGRVIYLAGENPDDVRMRWLAMSHHVGFDPADMDVHFIPGTFSIPAAIARITADVDRLGGVDLVIVDTSAAYFQGDDENGNTPLGKHAREMRQLCTLPGKPAVVVACHPVKNADQANLQPRGGGSFIAEVDGNLVLTRDSGFVRMHWQVKHRGADFAPLRFALETVTAPLLKDSKGRSVPTVMAVGVDNWVPSSARAAKPESWESALAILHEHGPMTEHTWSAAYIALEPGANAESVARKFRRHRAKLVDLGKVVLDDDVFSVPDTDTDTPGHVQADVRSNK